LVAAFDMAPARPRIMQHCLWRRRLFDPAPWTNNGVLPPHGPAGAAIPRLSGGPCGPITLPRSARRVSRRAPRGTPSVGL